MKKYLTLLLVSLCLANEAQVTFSQSPGSPYSNPSSSTGQRGYASKDLNNDGFKDLVVGNGYGGTLYVFLGTGTGSFTAAPGSPITVNSGPIYVTLADFNNDNLLDLATANYGSGDVTVMLGTGTGSFSTAPGSPISTGYLPYCIDAADFNLDGTKDLVMVNYGGNSVSVLLGTGTGSFTSAPGSPLTTNGPYHVSTGSFNSDNFPDFVVANGNANTVSVFLGTGTGSFTTGPGYTYTVGSQPRTITVVKDFNGDGYSDLVVTNGLSGDINILLGSSTGTFSSASGSPISVGNYPYQSAVADFDLNGTMDVITTCGSGNNLSVLLGNGNGTFTTATNSPLTYGNDPQSIVTSDFNNDNLPDLAFGDFIGSNVTILINASPPPCNLAAGFTYTTATSGIVNFESTTTGTVVNTTYTWNFGDGSPTGTGAAPSHTYLNGGTYTITLTAANSPSCTGTYTKVLSLEVIHVGIPELQMNNSIHISPNPTGGLVQVTVSNWQTNTEFGVYNVLGMEELRSNLPAVSSSLNLDFLQNGIYYYRLYQNNKVVKTGRIVLSK